MTDKTNMTYAATEYEAATKAIDIQSQIKDLEKQLEETKDQLRELADGDKMDIKVPGKGTVNITMPRNPSEKVELKINEEKLSAIPELKKKLKDKDIIREIVKTIPGAKASVRIQINV